MWLAVGLLVNIIIDGQNVWHPGINISMSSGGSPALACTACCRAANYATSILTNTIYDFLESESAMSNIPDHPYALPISIILTGECVDSCRATNKHQYWRKNPLTIGRLVGINIVCSYRYGFIYHLFNNHCGVGLLGDIDQYQYSCRLVKYIFVFPDTKSCLDPHSSRFWLSIVCLLLSVLLTPI